MTYDPTKLDDLEMLVLLSRGLISYSDRVVAGEQEPFPYPDTLIRGFNQLCLICALQGVNRAKRPSSIPEFVKTWGGRPLLEWPLKLEISVYTLSADDQLIEPTLDGKPTQLCQELAKLLNRL